MKEPLTKNEEILLKYFREIKSLRKEIKKNLETEGKCFDSVIRKAISKSIDTFYKEASSYYSLLDYRILDDFPPHESHIILRNLEQVLNKSYKSNI